MYTSSYPSSSSVTVRCSLSVRQEIISPALAHCGVAWTHVREPVHLRPSTLISRFSGRFLFEYVVHCDRFIDVPCCLAALRDGKRHNRALTPVSCVGPCLSNLALVKAGKGKHHLHVVTHLALDTHHNYIHAYRIPSPPPLSSSLLFSSGRTPFSSSSSSVLDLARG